MSEGERVERLVFEELPELKDESLKADDIVWLRWGLRIGMT